MNAPPDQPKYRRIRGRHSSFAGQSSLWEGEDHLLLAEVSGYVETYKRFYYRDIQAFVVQENRYRLFGNILLLIPVAFLAWPAIAQPAAAPMCLAFMAVFLGIAMVNTIQGPTCRTRLVTAVNVQPLPSLGRVPAANKALARILPRIEAAQGRLEDMDTLLEAMPEPVPATPARAPMPLSVLDLVPADTKFHRWTTALLGGLTVSLLLHVLLHRPVTAIVETIFLLGLLVLSVMALVRQSGRIILPPLRRWTWWVFGYEMGLYGLIYIAIMVASVKTARSEATPYEHLLGSMLDMSAEGVFAPFAIHAIAATGSLILFVAGLGLVQAADRRPAERPAAATPPPVPPAPPQEPVA